MHEILLNLGGRETPVTFANAIVAGWTGRDRNAVEAHIAELEALGVPSPSSAPVFYRVSASRITSANEIESTARSSGEVEAVLLRHNGQLWVGVGSDHTDRDVETYSVAVSKQLCDKPVAAELWPYEEVAGHWDELILRSWVDGDVSYQEGALAGLMCPEDLLPLAPLMQRDGSAMFCGTFPAIGGIRPSAEFRYRLEDPVAGRAIDAGYAMRELPLIS